MITAEEVMQKNYCEIDLDKAKRDAFVYAIKNHYWYQMYIDDLPIWGKSNFISKYFTWLKNVVRSKLYVYYVFISLFIGYCLSLLVCSNTVFLCQRGCLDIRTAKLCLSIPQSV